MVCACGRSIPYQSYSSTQYTVCLICATNHERMIVDLSEKLAAQEARLNFLKLKYLDQEQPNATVKGDVEILVDGGDHPLLAHSFILSDKSCVFRKMFDHEMLEKETMQIRISDTTLPTMRAVINYCYTSEIAFTDEVLPDEVLKVAHKYSLDLLRDVCEEALIKTINKDNLPKMLKLSHKFETKRLNEAASKFFKEHFDAVIGNVLEELCS